MSERRHFGSVRRRSSGRWQATYRYNGQFHSSGTFSQKADALAFLATVEADLRRGVWIDPNAGLVTVEEYANEWLSRRPDLAVRTHELYRHVLDRHVFPPLGHLAVSALKPSRVRAWHASIAQVHPATAAKAYRLLSSIMRTAVVDGLILSSPCRVHGAGVERPPERPVATVAEIEALEEAMPEHLRLIVSLAAWCQLRRGEILALRRKDFDQTSASVRIEQSRTFAMDGTSLTKSPKSAAGVRTIAMPAHVVAGFVEHLNRFTGIDPDAPVFTGRLGKPLTRDALQASWERARRIVGRPELRLHDLRHTGLTLAAATGATTAELMHRAGHATAAAALRYQHATKDRDRVVADALGELVGRRRGRLPDGETTPLT